MAKIVKTQWLGARVDQRLETRVKNYIDAAELTMGDLVRAGVEEYMANHPVKRPSEISMTETLKPGIK